ncbi:MAG TPA: hypothetical protein VFU05_02565 [Cyclobacteriaceae bacterium]|nr:hypothetical protein [Cyclobacteriaceae bacterium]
MIKFLLTLIIAALLILAVGQWGLETRPEYFYRTLVFLFIGTAGLYRFLLRTKQQRPDFFVQFYLATMVVKLIAYGAYLFIMVTSKTENVVADVAVFMVVYFIFTAIEIGFLYRHVNQ